MAEYHLQNLAKPGNIMQSGTVNENKIKLVLEWSSKATLLACDGVKPSTETTHFLTKMKVRTNGGQSGGINP